MTKCILSEYRSDKCASCSQLCPHRIALEGLDGKSGRLGNTGLPADYRGITLANSPARDEQAKNYEIFERYVETFSRSGEEPVKSLYLWSESPGTGKTTTASALLNEWIARDYLSALKAGEQPRQFSAYFLDVNAWQTDYNEFNRPRVPDSIAEPAAERYYRAMERTKLAPFAVLDDIGVREASENFRADLHAIINYRVMNAKPTVYTSNLPIEDMARVFDERLYDRIRDQCGVIHFDGKSRRGRR